MSDILPLQTSQSTTLFDKEPLLDASYKKTYLGRCFKHCKKPLNSPLMRRITIIAALILSRAALISYKVLTPTLSDSERAAQFFGAVILAGASCCFCIFVYCIRHSQAFEETPFTIDSHM